VKFVYVVLIAGAVATLRLFLRARKRRQAAVDAAGVDARSVGSGDSRPGPGWRPGWRYVQSWTAIESGLGDVGLVASREIRERVRSRIFRVGTLIVLLVVGAAVVIPTFHHGGGQSTQTVAVVGTLSPEARAAVEAAGAANRDSIQLVEVPSSAAAEALLRAGKVDFAIVDSARVLLYRPAASRNSPADPGLVQNVAQYLGVLKAYQAAGLTPEQAAAVSGARPVPVQTLEPATKETTRSVSVIGLVLLFFMLTQYNTWILIGVMQEKSSRVVEVLLATVRPIQLLGGKVLGIGVVALAQATLIVGFALIVATAVGSDVLHGTTPLVLGAQLLWLLLGYAFYCWVYAAGGSTAERQDQVQTLALPLSIPILIGYIFSITVASSGHPDLLFKILAYVPPTAPFCMPVLVGLGQVTWWQFGLSVLITLAGTAAVAMLAARIYRRAVLRTGGRVRLRELLGSRAG
jgi:ABC-2 type transport system permease protein